METPEDSSASQRYTSDQLDALSVSTAHLWDGIPPHKCIYGERCDDDCTGFDVQSLEPEDSTYLETAKQDNFQTDKVDLEANASFDTSRTAFSYNTESFISVGEMRGRNAPGPADDFAIREKPPALFKSFYQNPELNELNEYEDHDLVKEKSIVYDKPSQYQAEDMRDYTVCHTHPYWLKVQDLQKEEPQGVINANSVYYLN